MLVVLLVSTIGCYPEHNQSTFDPHGPVASRQLDIFVWILIGGTIVFVLVTAALVYAAIKFKRKDENEIPKQIHGNLRLEILWTVIPAIVVLGFSVASINTFFMQQILLTA
jgi:cytochrome c oxidase subunit 2